MSLCLLHVAEVVADVVVAGEVVVAVVVVTEVEGVDVRRSPCIGHTVLWRDHMRAGSLAGYIGVSAAA